MPNQKTAYPNSRAAIQQKAKLGQLSLFAVFTMLTVRPAIAFTIQVTVALFYYFLGSPDAWTRSAQFWTIYGTLVDLLSILLLIAFLRSEGTGIRDLIGYQVDQLPKDFIVGGVLFVIYVLVYLITSTFLGDLLFDGNPPRFITELPLWAGIFTVFVWAVVWTFSEQVIFNGYALPRLEVLLGNSLAAWLILVFFWSFQYFAMPFHPQIEYLLYRVGIAVPLTMLLSGVYLFMRRLPSTMFAQWAGTTFYAFVFGLLAFLE